MENTDQSEQVIDVNRLRVTGRRLLVRMCYNRNVTDEHGKVLIILPEKTRDYTNWAEIVGVGVKCKWFTPEHVGKLVHVPEGGDGVHFLGDGHWFIDEVLLDPVVYDE